MSVYLTLTQAKTQAGIPASDTTLDTQLEFWMNAAEQMVLGYLKTDAPDPVNERLKQAMLLVFTEFWRFRGDDNDGTVPKSRIPGEPSEAVVRLLYGLRTPALR